MSNADEKTWDRVFRRNIDRAKAYGTDLNDELDKEWPHGEQWATTYVLPHVPAGGAVLEIGPGTGRISRFVKPKAGRYIFADYSSFVCDFLRENYPDAGVILAVDCKLAGVADASVDTVFSLSVFGHLFEEQVYTYMAEARRVLKPGGKLILHHIDLRGDIGLLKEHMPAHVDKGRCVFRFLHPEYATLMASDVGFANVDIKFVVGRHYILTAD